MFDVIPDFFIPRRSSKPKSVTHPSSSCHGGCYTIRKGMFALTSYGRRMSTYLLPFVKIFILQLIMTKIFLATEKCCLNKMLS